MENELNCPNCGAPRTGTICEYCGTVFYNQDYIDYTDIRKAQIDRIEKEISYYNAVSSCWFPDYGRILNGIWN